MSDKKVLVPLLEKLVPKMLAQDILGVQPITSNYELVSVDTIDDVKWYRVRVFNPQVLMWIHSQNTEHYAQENFGWYERSIDEATRGVIKYVLHEQLFIVFALRWS